MKKILALCLAACFALPLFTACGENTLTETTESTGTNDTYPKSYEVTDGLLTSCIGQADENGVYVIPETITAIAESAFAGDTRLKKVVIGSQVKMIGSGAFQACSSLETVVIEEGVKELGSYAFYGCTSLTDVTLPSTIDYLNEYVFYGCTALERISLEHIRYIDNGALWYCNSLEKVTLSENLEHIATWAFAQNVNLSEINFRDVKSLKAIDDYAFTGCSMLLSLEIPEGVEYIGTLAFYECTRLASISIPSTVKMVDYAAFNYTPWYQESQEDYLIVGDGVLIKCAVHPGYLDLSDKNIKAIGGATFWNAANEGQAAEYGYKYASELETLTIPETVTAIGTAAFSSCYNLKEIILPASVITIADNAFNVYVEGIECLAKIDFSKCNDLKTIGAYAFQGCFGIDSMELPVSVEHVGQYAFAATKAYEDFMAKAAKAETEADRYFITGDNILLAAYVANDQTKINIPAGVKKIAGSAFSGWDNAYVPTEESMANLSDSGVSKYNISYTVKEISFPETLVEIGEAAFFRMLSVKKLVLPNSLKVIESDAFGFCDSLFDISGGGNVETVGDYAFRYCVSIPSFSFSPNTTSIGTGVFSGCSSLKRVYLPVNLVFPGTNLFSSECTALESVSVHEAARVRIYSILGMLSQNIKVLYYQE